MKISISPTQSGPLKHNVEQIRRLVAERVAEKIYNRWVELASQNISNSEVYVGALFIEQVSDFRYEVGFDTSNKEALKIEQGTPPFDMKEGFQNSMKAKKTKKGGWYLTIPFRLGTTNAKNKSKQFSNIMPRSVYDAIRLAVKQNTKVQIPSRYAGVVKPHHKSGIYEGVRVTNNGTNSSYNTFRRASNNSDPRAWIHPGFAGKNLFQQVMSSIDIKQITQEALNEIQL